MAESNQGGLNLMGIYAVLYIGPHQPGELSRLIGISSGGISKLIDKLVARGHAKRAHGLPDDLRAVTVSLTPAGRRHAKRFVTGLARQRDDLAKTAQELSVAYESASDERAAAHVIGGILALQRIVMAASE